MHILAVIGILFVTFVVIPWAAILIVEFIKMIIDDTNDFD